jgi:hypothetical protein
MEGYSHPEYAGSLVEFGIPRKLPLTGGWILERQISETPYKDAMGCYPLFTCRDWSLLRKDLEMVSSDLVSLALVTDPFANVSAEELGRCFDLVKPFKTHYVANLEQPLEKIARKTSRADARKSLAVMDVEICSEPAKYLNEWVTLYDNLIDRHSIRGVNAFSAKSFEFQLRIPGMIMALGRQAGEPIGAVLFLIQDKVCYGHLAAFTPAGYKAKAFSGILWRAMDYLQKRGVRLLDHGGHAGTKEDPKDGLVIFKKGWSNETRQVFFCGRIFDKQKYETICRQKNAASTEYFPAYRRGEFGSGQR